MPYSSKSSSDTMPYSSKSSSDSMQQQQQQQHQQSFGGICCSNSTYLQFTCDFHQKDCHSTFMYSHLGGSTGVVIVEDVRTLSNQVVRLTYKSCANYNCYAALVQQKARDVAHWSSSGQPTKSQFNPRQEAMDEEHDEIPCSPMSRMAIIVTPPTPKSSSQ